MEIDWTLDVFCEECLKREDIPKRFRRVIESKRPMSQPYGSFYLMRIFFLAMLGMYSKMTNWLTFTVILCENGEEKDLEAVEILLTHT